MTTVPAFVTEEVGENSRLEATEGIVRSLCSDVYGLSLGRNEIHRFAYVPACAAGTMSKNLASESASALR